MTSVKTKKKPGQILITIGLLIAVIGGLIVALAISSGGDARAWWMPAVGLVLACIGFAQRVLAALENKAAARD